mmetsp:Transcript_17921/g.39071  ORF Transcript_17921/g.39071 Transcript_17921/m.39071 type:complete len:85 (+) Transcript_17921:75-329(+)
MGTDIPAEGGRAKNAIIKDEKVANHCGQCGNNNARQNEQFAKKETFLGTDPNLHGYVFEARRSCAEQVANFEKVNDIIKAQIGM